MKVFFKQYSYNIIRDLLNQFAISIFGALLSMATTAANNNVLAICVSVFAIIFYLFLIYITMWDIGAKDKVSVDVGKKPYRPYTGFLISCVANIPKLVIAILITLSIFVAPTSDFMMNMKGIVSFISLLFNGMYTGLLMTIKVSAETTLISQWWIYFVIIIPALVTSWVAYIAGFKNFRIIAPLFDKKKKV